MLLSIRKQIVWRTQIAWLQISVGQMILALLLKPCKHIFWSITQKLLVSTKHLVDHLSSSRPFALCCLLLLLLFRSVGNFEIHVTHKICWICFCFGVAFPYLSIWFANLEVTVLCDGDEFNCFLWIQTAFPQVSKQENSPDAATIIFWASQENYEYKHKDYLTM